MESAIVYDQKIELPGDWKNTVKNINNKITAMRERYADPALVSWAKPSRYWFDYIQNFQYILDSDIPYACFKELRHHTYHLTGTMPHHYFQGWHNSLVSLSEVRAGYLELSRKMPANFSLSEPELLGGFGILIDRKLVNVDIVRYMASLATIYESGALSKLGSNPKVLEIGGGFGGFAYHFSQVVPTCQYFLVDLPETLLFSASYLSLLYPNKKVYLYDKADYSQQLAKGFSGFDYVILPNWTFTDFDKPFFDLVLNEASFQEMTSEQTKIYLDGIRKNCRGFFYSANMDRQPYNSELQGLFEQISDRFEVKEYFPVSSASAKFSDWLSVALKRELMRAFNAVSWRLKRKFTKSKSNFSNPCYLLGVPRKI